MDDARHAATKHWLEKADHDLLSAKVLLREMPILTDSICFHCQQAAEKALKAFLIYQNLHAPKVHDLSRLINECGKVDKTFHLLDEMLADMSDYAVDSRYASSIGEITLTEAHDAFSNAEKVMAFVKGKVGL